MIPLVGQTLYMGLTSPKLVSAAITPASFSGLFAYYKFDEGTGTTSADSGGNGFNGTFVGTPSWVAGKKGNALQFDGVSNALDITGMTALAAPNFTIVAWVFPIASSTNYACILTQGSVVGLFYRGATRKLDYYTGADNLNTTALTEGQWTHIAVVYATSGTSTFYINGAADGTFTGAAGTMTPTRIGSDPSNEAFKGKIDELAVYSRALTPTEISTLYNSYT